MEAAEYSVVLGRMLHKGKWVVGNSNLDPTMGEGVCRRGCSDLWIREVGLLCCGGQRSTTTSFASRHCA